MIHVKNIDGTFSKVSSRELQQLIDTKRIQSFLRSSGWVDIERGPIRRNEVSTQPQPGHAPLKPLRRH